jgi:hypothetical protein
MPIIAGRASAAYGAGFAAVTTVPLEPVAVSSYDALATITVPSGGLASVTFNGIPQTGYDHLQLRYSMLGSGDPTISLNGASPTAAHGYYGDGASASMPNMNIYKQYLDYAFSLTATNPMVLVMDFLDYTNTTINRTIRYVEGQDRNGSGEIMLHSKLWLQTDAVSTFTISATIAEYTQLSLYGVKE